MARLGCLNPNVIQECWSRSTTRSLCEALLSPCRLLAALTRKTKLEKKYYYRKSNAHVPETFCVIFWYHCPFLQMKLMKLLQRLPASVVRRLHRERYKKPCWITPVPDSHKLTDQDVTDFVESMKQPVLMAMFSKTGSMDAAQALQNLALMRPELVIPPVLEKWVCGAAGDVRCSWPVGANIRHIALANLHQKIVLKRMMVTSKLNQQSEFTPVFFFLIYFDKLVKCLNVKM